MLEHPPLASLEDCASKHTHTASHANSPLGNYIIGINFHHCSTLIPKLKIARDTFQFGVYPRTSMPFCPKL